MSPRPKHIPLGKRCVKTERTLEKIGMRQQPRRTTAFRLLKGSYAKLKEKRGVNFDTLQKSGYTPQMMMDLGMPTHELIIGHALRKGGLRELTSTITNMFHANDVHYKKMNFRTLVNQGIPIEKIHECGVQIGILLQEKFTREELIRAGYPSSRVDSVISMIKSGH